MTIVGLVSEGVKKAVNALYGSGKGDGYKASLGLTVQPVVDVNLGVRKEFSGSSAGNAVATVFTVPVGKCYKIDLGYVKLATDGTVANRYIGISGYMGSDTQALNLYVSGAVTASSTAVVSIEKLFFGTAVTERVIGWDNVFIEGDAVKISITSGVAGDTVSYRIRVREFDIK